MQIFSRWIHCVHLLSAMIIPVGSVLLDRMKFQQYPAWGHVATALQHSISNSLFLSGGSFRSHCCGAPYSNLAACPFSWPVGACSLLNTSPLFHCSNPQTPLTPGCTAPGPSSLPKGQPLSCAHDPSTCTCACTCGHGFCFGPRLECKMWSDNWWLNLLCQLLCILPYLKWPIPNIS